MKKTTLLSLFVLSYVSLNAQTDVTVKDSAKVGLINAGTITEMNLTQNITYNVLPKSAEYQQLQADSARLKKILDDKNAELDKAAGNPALADYIRKDRDERAREYNMALQRLTDFKNDVLRLADIFGKIPLNSQRLRDAKELFDKGKIREADNVLNAKEMQYEGDALLSQIARAQQTLQETDSLLLIKADEFSMKAHLKALDYGDSLRYDSAQIYFEQSRRYAETVENLWDFANFLWRNNQSHKAAPYLERAIQLTENERDEAMLTMRLGAVYYDLHRMDEAEKMYLHSLVIYKRFVKIDSTEFEPILAGGYSNLGNLYRAVQKIEKSEEMYLLSLNIRERLAKSGYVKFKSDLAIICMNLGVFYYTIQKMAESEHMSLRAFDIYKQLAKSDSVMFEPELAKTCMNLGSFYKTRLKMDSSEMMYLQSLEIYEKLAKNNPDQFEPDLAKICTALGNLYYVNKNVNSSEKMHLRSIKIYERLVKNNPTQFESDLAGVFHKLANVYVLEKKMMEAEKMYLRSSEIYDRLTKRDSAQFESELARVSTSFGSYYATVHKMAESEKMYLRALKIYERLSQSNPAQFEPDFALALRNMGLLKQNIGEFEEARKMYSQALAIREKTIINGNIYYWNDLALIYADMAILCDSFGLYGRWETSVAIQHERLACMEALSSFYSQAAKNVSNDYGNLAWYCLFARQYSEAQTAAEHVLIIDPTQNWVRTNLGHSFVLRGKWKKAKQVYQQYIANEKDPAEARATLLQDWDDLEKAGITHKDMEKARKWVRE